MFSHGKEYFPKELDVFGVAGLSVIGPCRDFGVEGHGVTLEKVNSRQSQSVL